jgi:hypothetical protein
MLDSSIPDRDLLAAQIESAIRACELSIAGVEQARLQLSMQRAELSALRRAIARRVPHDGEAAS